LASIEEVLPLKKDIQIPSTSPSGQDLLKANNVKNSVGNPQRLVMRSRKGPRQQPPPPDLKNM